MPQGGLSLSMFLSLEIRLKVLSQKLSSSLQFWAAAKWMCGVSSYFMKMKEWAVSRTDTETLSLN